MLESKVIRHQCQQAYRGLMYPKLIALFFSQIAPCVDSIFVGQRHGEIPFSALSLCMPVFFIMNAIAILITIGCSVGFVQECRRGENIRAGKVFTLSVALILFIGVLFSIIEDNVLDKAAYWLGGNDKTVGYVTAYLEVIMWGAPVYMLSFVVSYMLFCDNAPKLAMIATMSGTLTNILIDYIAIYLLDMGVRGAAIGTILSVTVECLVCCIHLFNKERLLRFKSVQIKDIKLLHYLKNGLPQSFSCALLCGRIWAINLMLLSLAGNNGIVVGALNVNLGFIMAIFTAGISWPLTPMVATFYAEKNPLLYNYVLKTALRYAAIYFFPIVLTLLIAPDLFSLFFAVDEQELISMSQEAIRIYAVSFFFAIINISLRDYLAAKNLTKTASGITYLRDFVLVVLLAWCFSKVWGINGIWYAFVCSELVVMTWICFSQNIIKDLLQKNSYNSLWVSDGNVSSGMIKKWSSEVGDLLKENFVNAADVDRFRNDFHYWSQKMQNTECEQTSLMLLKHTECFMLVVRTKTKRMDSVPNASAALQTSNTFGFRCDSFSIPCQ